MRVPYTWLKDFIDIDMDARELAEKLTFAGIEVDEIVDLRPSFSNVITAEVLTVDKHPDADRLFVTRVSDGKREYTVVAGIDNFAAGDKVPWPCRRQTPGRSDHQAHPAAGRGIKRHALFC